MLLEFILVNGTSNQDEARDLVQDILFTLRLKIVTYEGTGSLESWMWGVARRKIKAWQRDQLAHFRDLSTFTETGDDPEDRESGFNLCQPSSEKFLNSLAARRFNQEAARQKVQVRLHTMPNQDGGEEKPTRKERRRSRVAKILLPGRHSSLKDPHLRRALWRRYRELSREDQQVLTLWSRDLTARKIGEILGISEDAAEKRVKRACERLRVKFKDWRDAYRIFFVGNHGG